MGFIIVNSDPWQVATWGPVSIRFSQTEEQPEPTAVIGEEGSSGIGLVYLLGLRSESRNLPFLQGTVLWSLL